MASVTVTIRAASNAAAACLRSSVGSRPSMMAAACDNLYIRVRDKGNASYRFAGGGGNRHKHPIAVLPTSIRAVAFDP